MDRELFIDGGWRKAVGGARLEINDPPTGERVGSTALAEVTDVDRAVAAAQHAQPIWVETFLTHPFIGPEAFASRMRSR
jgi:acyl-CoA reductase-like NAD-dependent aldehyde dehydrogenase